MTDFEDVMLHVKLGHIIDKYEQDLFDELVEKFELPTGDMSPEHFIAIDEMKKQLEDILVHYIKLNKKGGDK